MDLFDFILENMTGEPTLCSHAYRVGAKKDDGWTYDANPDSQFFGYYVHSDADCRRPAFWKGQNEAPAV